MLAVVLGISGALNAGYILHAAARKALRCFEHRRWVWSMLARHLRDSWQPILPDNDDSCVTVIPTLLACTEHELAKL